MQRGDILNSLSNFGSFLTVEAETYYLLCTNLARKGVWGRMDTFVCMAEFLHCSPETTTTLLMAIHQYKIKS